MDRDNRITDEIVAELARLLKKRRAKERKRDKTALNSFRFPHDAFHKAYQALFASDGAAGLTVTGIGFPDGATHFFLDGRPARDPAIKRAWGESEHSPSGEFTVRGAGGKLLVMDDPYATDGRPQVEPIHDVALRLNKIQRDNPGVEAFYGVTSKITVVKVPHARRAVPLLLPEGSYRIIHKEA